MASYERTVLKLVSESNSSHASGDLAGAIDKIGRACAMVREAIEADPQSRANLQQLGSMLYQLGEWEYQSDNQSAAREALTEAASAYRRLASVGGPRDGSDPDLLIADVLVRRAKVCGAARRPLSAISDLQEAVRLCLDRVDRRPGQQRRVDAARVLGHAAYVLWWIGGDPDLAVGAADWALREYRSAFRVGNQFAVPAMHAPAVRLAGTVAYVVHAASGRADLAEAARSLTSPGGDLASEGLDWMMERTAAQPTLAQVLGAAGKADLVEQLTAPATDMRLFVPASRCHPQVAPAYVQALVEVQTSGIDVNSELLVGLEAHALLAAASQAKVPGLRYQFSESGPHWIAALLNYGQRHAEHEVWPAAEDAADWLTGVVTQLVPFTFIDQSVRRHVLAALDWQESIYDTVGNTAAAADCAQLLTSLGEPGGEPDPPPG